jgi:hypothetical protein
VKASQGLLFLVIFILLLGGGVMGFNYFVDAQCYYNCDKVDINRYSTNSYYRVAQDIKKHPEAEIIVVGSSRGGTTSPLWISEITGKKALNLSVAGSEVFARSAFIEMALQDTKVKTVLWYADFFEILGGLQDDKITKSPALYRFIQPDAQASLKLSDLQTLIDRNTVEASIHALKRASLPIQDGSDIDYKACSAKDYPGGVSDLRLQREIDLLYESYSRQIFSREQRADAWGLFVKTMKHLEEKNIRTILVIPPYHPHFREKLKTEQPVVWKRHLDWINNLKALPLSNLQVVNYFEGYPSETGSAKHWDDGVHFNCHSAILMTEKLLKE